MKKILLLICALPLLCRCQGSSAPADTATATEATAAQATQAPGERIATLSEEVRMLMEQYDAEHKPELLEQAMSINDSIEQLDTTQQGRFNTAFTRAQLLAKSGHMREAMLIQERLLSSNPNDFVRLQFYAGKYRMEGKTDSMHIFADRALAQCDIILADTTLSAEEIDQALMNKINIYQIVDNRAKAKETNDKLAARHLDDPDYQLTDAEFNEEFNAARTALNQSAEAYRNDVKKNPTPAAKQ
ncbi:MAG: hypothetical protein Q4B68_00505 [Bacteroidales bacterium]|nr:hypothetical protein [Bacteroidales bacterium]